MFSLAKLLKKYVALGALACAAVFIAGIVALRPKTTPPAPVIRTYIPPPDKTVFNFRASQTGALALSPDGRRLVFGTVAADGKKQLWIRPLDAPDSHPLAGTDGAFHPFWSPDATSIGFFADGKLKRLDISGGLVLTLCDAPDGRGGTWNRDGTIVFAPNVLSVLHRVSQSGGASVAVTSLDQARRETSHRGPWFLPDGRHFLYQALAEGTTAIRVASLDSPENKVISEVQSSPAHAQEYLLFAREATLMAQRFDLKALATTGPAIPLAERIEGIANRPAFSVSETGLLVYQAANENAQTRLAWLDRGGKRIATLTDFGDSPTPDNVQLSPDGKSAAVDIAQRTTRKMDIWLYDTSRGLRTRLTFDPANDRHPVWSPDGRTIVFSSDRQGHYDLYRMPANGTGAEELLYADALEKTPTSWSHDGKFLLYTTGLGTANPDIWVLPLAGKRKPFAVANTAAFEGAGQFSPDGRWITLSSGESGRAEVYAVPFSGSASGLGGKRQVSPSGGFSSRWRRDGKEIFFHALDRTLMTAAVTVNGNTLDVGAVRPLFGLFVAGGFYRYDVSPDGQRFLAFDVPEQNAAQPLTLVQNWTAALSK